MSTLSVDTITKADGSGALSVPAESGTVVTTASPSLGRRNLIINGAMVIDQRNGGSSVSTSGGGAYVPDRWNIVENSDATGTAQQVSDSPDGFNYSFKLTTGTADTDLGTTQYCRLLHNIEGYNIAHLGWGTSAAQDVTLSFWVKSSLTGTFGCSISNSARNRSYPFTYSISSADTWEQKTVTIPADTTGTWLTNNGIGMRIYFGLGYGTTYAGTAGAWASTRYESATGGVSVIGTASATWQITGVQLEVGSVATPFEHRSYGEELALCQRYYASMDDYLWIPLTRTSDNLRMGSYYFPQVMRSVPSITATVGLDGISTYSQNNITTRSLMFRTDGSAASVPRVQSVQADAEL